MSWGGGTGLQEGMCGETLHAHTLAKADPEPATCVRVHIWNIHTSRATRQTKAKRLVECKQTAPFLGSTTRIPSSLPEQLLSSRHPALNSEQCWHHFLRSEEDNSNFCLQTRHRKPQPDFPHLAIIHSPAKGPKNQEWQKAALSGRERIFPFLYLSQVHRFPVRNLPSLHLPWEHYLFLAVYLEVQFAWSLRND